MTEETKIETEHLRLRSWRNSDIQPYTRACNSRAVMRWLGGVQTPAEVATDVNYFVESEAKDGITYWVVERLSDNAILGFCGLVRIPDRDCPIVGEWEIGWRLGQNYWREGYGHEAACAILTLAFDYYFSIDTVFSRTAPGNKASRALMTKLGLERCPELDYVPAGESAKLLVYSITRRKWEDLSQSGCVMQRPTKVSPHSIVHTLIGDGGFVTTFEWMTEEEARCWDIRFEIEDEFMERMKKRQIEEPGS